MTKYSLHFAPGVLDFLGPADRELTKELLGGKPVADLASELEGQETAGDLTADEIEQGLWALVGDQLVEAARKAGEQAAEQATDEQGKEWPAQGVTYEEATVESIGIKGQPPRGLSRAMDAAFRESYAAARA